MRSGDKKIDIAYGSFCEVEGSCVAGIVVKYIMELMEAVLVLIIIMRYLQLDAVGSVVHSLSKS